MTHTSIRELASGLEYIREAPRNEGELKLIVRRPANGESETLFEAVLDPAEGLVGDNWKTRDSRHTPDGRCHPEMQITMMNTRVVELIARNPARWQLAGDQFYIDLSSGNLPPGTQLRFGEAVIEITSKPHLGCRKFVDRFGLDAMRFISSTVHRDLNLRGVNARVVRAGRVRTGDFAKKI